MGNFDKSRLDDYNDVPARMAEFFQKYPEGSLQQVNVNLVKVAEQDYVIYTAAAKRQPGDTDPGHGTAWEVVPGKTSFTKDSELQNAETSAWGRAILAVGAADTKKGIASREEVRNRMVDNPRVSIRDGVIERVPNRDGQDAVLKLCEEKKWDPRAVALLFQAKYHKSPRDASNEELNEFVSLVRGGLISIDEPAPASA